MLRDIEAHLGVGNASEERRGLAFLRDIDQRISALHPDHLRYPPGLLAEGLIRAIRGEDPATAAKAAVMLQGHDVSLDFIVESFVNRLEAIPTLRLGVRDTILVAADKKIPILVITEGAKERIIGTLEHYNLFHYVTTVIENRKSRSLFESIKESSPQRSRHRSFMVGDQLDRDIAFSQQAGFETFYFPSSFRPYWHDESLAKPDHEIRRYDELIPFLGD